jgi:hypothetical protein
MFKARVKALLETSHHEGLCVREEDYKVKCEYKAVEKDYIVDIPKKYRDRGMGGLSIDQLDPDEWISLLDQDEWISLLPKPTLMFCNTTRQCCNSDESNKKGLGLHQYRYKILFVEIFEVIASQIKEKVDIRKARVRALLETSDHDGYCSDEECIYKAEEKEYIVDIPEKYVDHSDGFFSEDEMKEIDFQDWTHVLPIVLLGKERDCSQSEYCDLSKMCKQHNLDIHEYRYTIFSVQIFETAIITVLYNGFIEHTYPSYTPFTTFLAH